MNRDHLLKKITAITILTAVLFSGFSPYFLNTLYRQQGKIVDESQRMNSWFFGIPEAEAAPKTKTVVFLIGSIVPTTATSTASAATSTYSFVIGLPDMIPTIQPIRSAYILYSAWQNTTGGITASAFTLNKQGGTAQILTSPKLTGGTNQQLLSIRLDATSAMRALIGNASGTYAMTFTANITGPSRVGEGAELYLTYDYDPLAPTQVNTAYQWVHSTSTQLGTSAVTSAAFNFNLPESSATTTFAVGASSTNQFWAEYRGFISTSTNVTATVGWNAETTSTATFTQTASAFSFLLLSPPKTTSTSPSANNTFKMVASIASGISAPTAIAIATYSFNFSASATLRKTIQLLLAQSTSTTSATTTINTTTAVNIPESSPSSTSAFLFGRLSFSTSTNPGINASMTTSTCSTPATTAITMPSATTRNAGYPTIIWNVTASSSVNTSGNWNVCSSFTRGTVVNTIPGLTFFLSYNYAKSTTVGSRFNNGISFLGSSHMATGTTFAAAGINTSIADASATAAYSWLDAEFDNNAAGSTNQVLTLGIGSVTNSYTFLARGSGRRQGATFTATSSIGFSSNTTTTVQCSVACINDAGYNVFGQTDFVTSTLNQVHYHWRYDNGSESAATAAANEDTSTTTAQGTVYRLRFEILNGGDATSSANNFRIEYQANATSGAWTQLATSTVGAAHWQMSTSSQVADGTATTNIATSTGGTTDNGVFLAGEVVASSSRNQSAAVTLSNVQMTEEEYAIKATSNATNGTTYYFRLTKAGTTLDAYTIYASSTVSSSNSPPSVTGVVLNHGNAITLNPNATTSVDVNWSVSDPNGCSDINTNAATSTAFRGGASSTCAVANPTTNNLNCYLYVTRSTSTCSGTTINATDTVQIYYFAQATDASSSYPNDVWYAYAIANDAAGATSSATSTGVELNTLLAINITTSSVNYGTVLPSNNTGATNQTSTVQNAGNASTTLKLNGTALTLGSNSVATSSQHYATSTFTFGGAEQVLQDVAAAVSGFLLTSPTSTTAVQSNIFWGITVPTGNATGTYTGTNTFTAVFSP